MKKLLLTAGLLLTALAPSSQVFAEDLSLRIATEGSFAPFNFIRPDGTLDGFEVELTYELCKRMNAKCEFITQDWDGLIPGLNAKKFDAILAGMSITEEREKVVDFSIPYEQGLLGFATLEGSPLMELAGTGDSLNIGTRPEELEALLEKWKPLLKGKTIGVQGSTIGANFLDKYLSDTVEISEYRTTDEHDMDLLNGRVDAIFAAQPNFVATMEKPDFANMKMVGTALRGGVFGTGVGVALRKNEPELKEQFNKAIKEAIDDGYVRDLSLRWFKLDLTPSDE
jgi:octopine/nopaline transport system substrate-binding protein